MEKEEIKKSNLKNFTDLFRNTLRIFGIIFRNMPWLFSSMLLLSVIVGVIPVFSAQALGTLIDRIIEAVQINNISVAYPALILFAVLTAVPTALRDIMSFLDRRMFLKTQDLFQIMALQKRASFDIAQHEDPKFQDRLQRAFNNDIYPIINVTDNQIMNLEVTAGIVAGSIAAAAIDWRVFVLVFITAIPDFLVQIKYGSRIWSIWSKHSNERRRFDDLRSFFTWKTAIIDSKIYQATGKFISDIKNILHKFTNEQLSAESWQTWAKVGASIFSAIGLFAGIAIIINEAIAGVIAIGTVVFVFQTLNRVSGWTSSLLSNTARMLERNLYVTDIFAFFDQEPIMKYSENPKKFPDNTPTIVFENVSFKYPTQEKMALKNVSFTVTPGQKIGLVGNNAAGKTTLIKLLLRIYDPVEGKITVDGIDLKEISLDDWWRHMGVLLQDFTTYNFTVRESIGVGDISREINLENVKDSAIKSTSSGFIEELPNKYEHMTGVEFGGIEPSKGQRQKLAIGRAFYKGKKLLVLDEPTASVDAESADFIFNQIESLPDTISAILISHNFATIKRADEIIVLHEGEIVEKGKHGDLLKLNGRYAEAYHKQKKDFE